MSTGKNGLFMLNYFQNLQKKKEEDETIWIRFLFYKKVHNSKSQQLTQILPIYRVCDIIYN